MGSLLPCCQRFSLLLLLLTAVCLAFSPTRLSPARLIALYSTKAPDSGSSRVREIVVISENRKALGEYEIEERYEAGLVLVGTEVKSCRKNSVQLSDGVAEIRDGEAWLLNVHISEYERSAPRSQHPPKRMRKLLLNAREILKLEQRVLQRGLEIIPLRLFFNEKSYVKVELGVGKKKSLGDKRDDITKRDGEREVRRVMKRGSDD